MKKTISLLFNHLTHALQQITSEAFTKPLPLIHLATIGQHVRHIIEFYLELNNGFVNGTINYNNRKRDIALETNIVFCVEVMNTIVENLDKPNIELLLATEHYINNQEEVIIATNYHRELLFNIDHTIHHMALIKIAFSQVSTNQLSKEFGVAQSTLKYKLQCAQ